MRAIILEKLGGLDSLVYKEILGRRAVISLTSPSLLIRGIGGIFERNPRA
jgi:hypothetical protein